MVAIPFFEREIIMNDVYKISKSEYPLIPLRGLWAFPNTILNFDCARSISKKAIEDANLRNTDVFLVNQKNIFDENPNSDSLYDYGMVVSIKESFNLPNGDIRVYVSAKAIGKIEEVRIAEGFYKAKVTEYKYIEEDEEITPRKEALRKLLIDDFKRYVELDGNVYDESVFSIGEVTNIHKLADIIIYHLDLKANEYYDLLKELDSEKRLTLLHQILCKEIDLKNLSIEIDQEAIHVYIKDGEDIVAYLRVLDRGIESEDVAIGRVIAKNRRQGLGTLVLKEGIIAAKEFFDADAIYLEAQTYAKKFYENLGFVQISDEFLLDGIAHIKMRLIVDKK